MPLSNLFRSAAGTCPFCNQKAGILSREHPECLRAHQAGWHEMVQLAAQAAESPDFDGKPSCASPCPPWRRSPTGTKTPSTKHLEKGWKLGVGHSMADGIITQEQEARLREFRDQLALGSDTADPGAMGNLNQTACLRSIFAYEYRRVEGL